MSKREIKLYVSDIKECIGKIERYTKGMSFDEFIKDEKTLDAVVRNIEIIGEAARNIPEEIRDRYKEILWYEIIGIRNKIAHEYFGVDEEVLWEAVSNDIPKLKEQIEKIVV